jgi:hypothetical protein
MDNSVRLQTHRRSGYAQSPKVAGTLGVRECACGDAKEAGKEALTAMQTPDFDLGIGREAQEHAVNLAWLVLAALGLVIAVVDYLVRRKRKKR